VHEDLAPRVFLITVEETPGNKDNVLVGLSVSEPKTVVNIY